MSYYEPEKLTADSPTILKRWNSIMLNAMSKDCERLNSRTDFGSWRVMLWQKGRMIEKIQVPEEERLPLIERMCNSAGIVPGKGTQRGHLRIDLAEVRYECEVVIEEVEGRKEFVIFWRKEQRPSDELEC